MWSSNMPKGVHTRADTGEKPISLFQTHQHDSIVSKFEGQIERHKGFNSADIPPVSRITYPMVFMVSSVSSASIGREKAPFSGPIWGTIFTVAGFFVGALVKVIEIVFGSGDVDHKK